MPSRQINDFLPKGKQKEIELVTRDLLFSSADHFNPFSSFYSPPLPNKDKDQGNTPSGGPRSRTPPVLHSRDRRVSGGVSPLPTLVPRPASELLGSPNGGAHVSVNGNDSEKGSGNDSIQDDMERVQSSIPYLSGKSIAFNILEFIFKICQMATVQELEGFSFPCKTSWRSLSKL